MSKTKKVSCAAYLFYETDAEGNRKEGGIIGINPVYKTTGAACADVAIPVKVALPPHETTVVDLWVGFEIPEGYKVVMYPRSSLLVKRGIMQPVSIIDSDYSGQHVHVPLHNMTNTTIFLEAGERVAQIECVPAYDCEDWQHDNTERAKENGGFGSTGV